MKALPLIALALLAGCDRIPGTTASLEREARAALDGSLNDAESARFQNLSKRQRPTGEGGRLICGEVNAKNRMGAYVGFVRFVADPARQSAMSDPQFVGDANTLARADNDCRSARDDGFGSISDSLCRGADEQHAAMSNQMQFNQAWATTCQAKSG